MATMKKPDGVRPEPALIATQQRANYSSMPAHGKYVPDLTGILTDDQITDLGRIKIGLHKAEELVEHINTLATDTGLPLRLIPIYPLKLTANDIVVLMTAHNAGENRIREAAFAAVEMKAA